ncbi:unnamed protein product, partial [marine sediment metagenome]
MAASVTYSFSPGVNTDFSDELNQNQDDTNTNIDDVTDNIVSADLTAETTV